ncbi:MAG: winged helix-turn-helix domain-containing protein [Psychromonas sp.]|nr:winged helix-turn-helix domain-containing protein [Psychromonas sp.]
MGINEYHTIQKIISNSKGSDIFITNEQTALIINHLSEVTYFNMSDIQEYISRTLDVKYSIPGLQKWLHRNKFSYKQFKGVPHKYEQEKQDILLKRIMH